MFRRLCCVVIGVMCGWPAIAAGQDRTRPRLEVGGQAGAMLLLPLFGGDGGFIFVTGPRISVGVTRRWNLELTADVFGPHDSNGMRGVYQLVGSSVLRESGSSRNTLLMSFGVAGFFRYARLDERRETRPDGSILVLHAHSEGDLRQPVAAVGGLGFHRVASKRLAIRSDLIAWIIEGGVLFRATAGVSIPIGSSYAVSR